MKYGLAPIVNDECEMIILGSLPGEASLNAGQYYAHPQNHFWQIMSCIFNESPKSYDEKCQMLLRHKIALWDVIHCAEREGSLDSKIKNAVPNDFAAFFKKYPKKKKIIFNGNESENQYKKHFKNLEIPHIKARSTSPIPAKNINTLAEKTENWRNAISKNINLY